MLVKEFIEKHNEAIDKDKFLSESLVTKYVPYRQKVSDCRNIIDYTTKKNEIFKINTPLRLMLFSCNILVRYYDLEFCEGYLDDYELMDEIDLINIAIAHVPEKEISDYFNILNSMLDDYMSNTRDLVSFLETKIDAINLAINTISDTFEETLNAMVPQTITSEVAE